MINPVRLTEDLFDDENLPDFKLRSFTEDFLLRLNIPANNPGGIYNGIISDISTKYTNFFGKITDEATKEAISEGFTLTMEASKTAMIDQIIKLEGLVSYEFGKTSSTYQAFYPQGLAEYHDADLPELPTLFTRFVNACTANLGAHPNDVIDTQNLKTAWDNARTAQLTLFGELDTVGSGRRQDRKTLTLGLTTAMLTIAIQNLENPDNFNNYYNPAYLPLTEDSISVSGLINFSATIMAVDSEVVTSSSDLRFFNQGTEQLIFSISDQPGVIHPTYQIVVMPGTDVAYTDTLPVFAQYYVNIQNPDAINNGKWKVQIGA